MTFDDILAQVLDLLQCQERVSYSALRRRFEIDDAYLEDLKDELLFAHPVVDEEGRGLVWTGDQGSPPAVSRPASGFPPSADQEPEPLSYTPSYLAEKILTSRSALEGERKQVTVLFVDIKDSTKFVRDLDPEDAQKLLDPAIHIMMEAVHHFEGTVNQVLGDGIMALFGVPIAHEDHFASLLSLPVPENRYPPLNLTPQRQRQKTLEAIVAIVLELSERQPVLFILEDTHHLPFRVSAHVGKSFLSHTDNAQSVIS